jgi:hypothetical protein
MTKNGIGPGLDQKVDVIRWKLEAGLNGGQFGEDGLFRTWHRDTAVLVEYRVDCRGGAVVVAGARVHRRLIERRPVQRDNFFPRQLVGGTAPLIVVCINATTLWHIDAVEWAPSTASGTTDWQCLWHVCFSPYSDGIAALRHLWIILCRLAGALGHRAIRQTSVLRIGDLLNSQVNDFRAFGGGEVPRKSG